MQEFELLPIPPNSKNSYLEELKNLEILCFESNPWSYKNLEEHLSNHSSEVLLYKKIIVGYLLYIETEYELEILRIAVVPEYRRKKVGSKLLEFLFTKNKNIFLEVHINNLSAIEFYKNNNFSQISVRKNYYQDGGDAIIFQHNRNSS